MREHIRRLIDLAARPAENGSTPADGARLAAEAVRLARLAASTHMVLRAMAVAREGAGQERRPA